MLYIFGNLYTFFPFYCSFNCSLFTLVCLFLFSLSESFYKCKLINFFSHFVFVFYIELVMFLLKLTENINICLIELIIICGIVLRVNIFNACFVQCLFILRLVNVCLLLDLFSNSKVFYVITFFWLNKYYEILIFWNNKLKKCREIISTARISFLLEISLFLL